MSHQFSRSIVHEDRLWCPFCEEYVKMLKIPHAAEIASVNRRTIYRYIEEGKIYATKIAGGTYRVCSHCLFKPRD